MFEWTAFLADLVVIGGVVYAIRRWKPFKWWLTLGYWFNAQTWGARDHTISLSRCRAGLVCCRSPFAAF